jgi:GxxExxY protein
VDLNDISRAIVDAAIEVHKELGGPGLLESVYEESLAFELVDRGFEVERQKSVPLTYKGHQLGSNLRLDLLVQKAVIVECKAHSVENDIFEIQALTYLRILDLKLALVINFGRRRVIDGVKRVVNGL